MHNFMHECVPDDNEPIRPKGTLCKSLFKICVDTTIHLIQIHLHLTLDKTLKTTSKYYQELTKVGLTFHGNCTQNI